MTSNILMVAAIDFGTTFSGYAFSTTHDFKANKLQINANQSWNSGTKQLLSLKTPTCVLLKKNKELVSFGYEAENDYSDFVRDGKMADYLFFQRFKMILYDNEQDLSLETELEDVCGRSIPAVEVFAASIKALHDHLHETLRSKTIDIKKDEIKWVITVPAIWSDKAKQFMRKSAMKAGIKDDHLVIALEPENASIYCQCLPINALKGCHEGFTNIQNGTKYLVIDIGGGTTDITAHRKLGENKMVELCKATGDSCGGASVDKEFLQIFSDIIGEDLMETMKKRDVDAYLDLCRVFEHLKRNLRMNKRPTVNMTIPFVALDELCRSHYDTGFEAKLLESKYSDKVKLFKDHIRIDSGFMTSLFKSTIDRIIALVKRVLSNETAKDISVLLLVGGFSECHLVQEAITRSFGDKIIILPDEPELAVIKGAVIFGHMPNFIDSRCLRRTYGRRIAPIFKNEIHDRSKLVTIDGFDRCCDVFEPFMTVNKSVPVGTIVKLEYHTIERNSERVNVAIYVTEDDPVPQYVDDSRCRKLGEFIVNIANPSEERRYVLVRFTFGDTEIKAEAMEKESKTKCKATLKLI